ncbi:hypothetical protein D8674_035771 [Pyrus ussuriensis x Pyrus communis]|uniref:Uncharacterized protein n=1 Tax=Pyrus ussuriensis x Pyrus communis TaxID=2448454 RepID=A0A5N5GDB5_9ROSA|nr:hypothetical protein D8674_035771 [Pyrus ussuriensis x Pyrus communis]
MTLLPASIQIQRTGSGGTSVILHLGVVVVDVVRGMVLRGVDDGLQVERGLTGGVPGGQSGVWVRDYRERI